MSLFVDDGLREWTIKHLAYLYLNLRFWKDVSSLEHQNIACYIITK